MTSPHEDVAPDRRLERATSVALALIGGELLLMARMVTHWVPTVRGLVAEIASRPAATARIALSSWWLPLWMAVLSAIVVAALADRHAGRRRLTTLRCGFALGLLVLAATCAAAYLPVWTLAASIK